MNSIGARLRQERLRQGFEISQIAELTKISPMMLEAIEADDLDRLPGSFFTRSFVRQYAKALGLDEDEFEADLRRLAGFGQPETLEPQPVAPEPRLSPSPIALPPVSRRPSKHSLGSLVIFLLILLACSALYTLWQRARRAPSKPAVAAERSVTFPPVKAATPPPVPSPSPTVTPASLEAAAPTPTPEPTATPTPEPVAGAAQTAAIRLELRATAAAWLRVVCDGKVAYSGLLQPGEERVFEGKEMVTLRAGNAGALAATYNGRPVGELGPEGQVRTIQFTPTGFTVVAPAPKPAAPADEP
jgi:cytoskeleton protein RodZ